MINEGIEIGEYGVQERIGHGASAIVYRGVHRTLGREVVLKFLPAISDDVTRSRFFREAAALRRMSHPNIVTVLDTGEAEGMPYMVFDYIAGGSLAERMEAGPLSVRDALIVLDGVAKGLDHAHRRSIVHRDVKPANVLMDPGGTPVIADFGLVRMLEQPTMTAVGMFAGTPAYMSPEQAEGREIGPASDQYSLAAMAYELLTGQVPFPGDTVSEVLTALLTRPPAAPSTVRTGLSAEVDAVLLRGLAKKPADRWPSCQAFVDAILGAMVAALPNASEAPLPASASSPAAATPAPHAVPAITLQPAETYLTLVVPMGKVRKPRQARRRLVAMVAATLSLGAVAATAYVAMIPNVFAFGLR